MTEPIIGGPDSRSAVGTTLGLGCLNCPYRQDCGGIVSDYDCLAFCCNEPANCKIACPRSHRLGVVVADSGGWNRRIPKLKQDKSAAHLPLYVPCIQNGSQRTNPLDVPIVAIPTFSVARKTNRFESGSELRKHFRIAPTSRVLLVSVKDDPELEAYWQYSALRESPEYLSSLDIAYITAPNFSFANNAPRTEHLVNRARSLTCMEEFSKAGLNVIPHLNACSEHQWDFWADFLREHEEISIVCKEFQTGAAIPRIAQWHMQQLDRIQQRIGRSLHLIAVGGRRHLQLFVGMSSITIVDSDPFFKAVFRRTLSRQNGHWKVTPTSAGEPIDQLLRHNVETYAAGIRSKFDDCKQYSLALRSGSATKALVQVTDPADSDTGQMTLWTLSTAQPTQLTQITSPQ